MHMHLRDLVKRRWADAGLYARQNAHMQRFLAQVDDPSFSQCWDQYVPLFRQHYYDLFDEVVPPLFSAPDKLLRVVLIRQLDLSQPKELEMVRGFVRHADPVADRPELDAILAHGEGRLKDEFAARPELEALVDAAPVLQRKPTNMVRPPTAKRRSRRR